MGTFVRHIWHFFIRPPPATKAAGYDDHDEEDYFEEDEFDENGKHLGTVRKPIRFPKLGGKATLLKAKLTVLAKGQEK